MGGGDLVVVSALAVIFGGDLKECEFSALCREGLVEFGFSVGSGGGLGESVFSVLRGGGLGGSETPLLRGGGLGFALVRVGEVVDCGVSGESSGLWNDFIGFISTANSFNELVGKCNGGSVDSDDVEFWRPIRILGTGRGEGTGFLAFSWEVVREKRTRADMRSGSITLST